MALRLRLKHAACAAYSQTAHQKPRVALCCTSSLTFRCCCWSPFSRGDYFKGAGLSSTLSRAFSTCAFPQASPARRAQETIRLSVTLPSNASPQLLRLPAADICDPCVGDIKKAIIAEFSRFKGVDVEQIQLFKLDGTHRVQLEATHTLHEAGVSMGCKLEVELAPAAQVMLAPVAVSSAAWLASLDVAKPNDEVAAAVAAIRAGRATRLPGGHIHLDGATWPCATNSELFVRKCYDPLFSSILGKLLPAADRSRAALRQRRFIVAGQPGIGKSVLAWYIIFRLLTEQPHRAIVYVDNMEMVYLIVPGEPVRLCSLALFQLHAARLANELTALDPVFVCDSYLPPTTPFPCLVVSSPGRLARENARDSEKFKQHYMRWLYAPVFSEAEVLELRELAFKDLPEDLVKRRMVLWGPNPRYVLAQTSIDEQLEACQWEKAKSAGLQDLILATKAQFFRKDGGDEADAPHRFVMERCLGQDAPAGSPESDMHNLAYWRRGAVVFASAPMARHVLDRVVKA